MQNFDVNATSLTICFTCLSDGEQIELTVVDIPCANLEADSIHDSENSTEEHLSYDETHSYRVVLYVNTGEGNIEVFDAETDEEIVDFNVEAHFDNI